MKVKIGGKIYDSNDTPIMLILSEEDKGLISSMRKDNYKYCSFPRKDTYTPTAIRLFMEADDDKKIYTEGFNLIMNMHERILNYSKKDKPVDIIEMNKGTYEYLKSIDKINIKENASRPVGVPYIGEYLCIYIKINESLKYKECKCRSI